MLICVQASAQLEIIEQQKSRIRDLEMSVRQWEGRYTDQREVSAGVCLCAYTCVVCIYVCVHVCVHVFVHVRVPPLVADTRGSE
jgi:hypothetical protein